MIAAEVYLWGTRIGVVEQSEVSDIPRFNYDKKFLRSGIEVSPIVMPLSETIYTFPALNKETFHGLPGLLADSLPDRYGTKLVERYLAEQGRNLSDLTAVERLCYTGQRGMGALEYVPSMMYMEEVDQKVDIDALVKLASDILREKKVFSIVGNEHAMEQIIRVGTSAGGARAKAVIAWNEVTNDIKSGQITAGDGYGYWIIKFDGVSNNRDKGDREDGPAYTRIEYAYHLMAVASGIDMSECRLYKENNRYHFMTKRFDRNDIDGSKMHMQTLGALAHYDYNEPGVYGYEQVADVIYQLGASQEDVEKLFRRMVFNVVTRNHDDHVKNISFLMDKKGQWRLSPAYDVTYAYDPTNRWLACHQMSVNGKIDNFSLSDLEQCAKRMNIGSRRTSKIIDEVFKGVAQWERFAEEAFLSEEVCVELHHKFLTEL